MKSPVKFILSFLICFAAAGAGSFFTSQSVNDWYRTLKKPAINPPSWIFSPVWIILFIMMAISLYFLWIKNTTPRRNTVLALFFCQLILNFLWSFLFFGLQSPFLAFLEIIILWIFIALTIILSYKEEKRSALLLTPYFLWVSFAGILNYLIFAIN